MKQIPELQIGNFGKLLMIPVKPNVLGSSRQDTDW